jgi:hypothetical protein
MGLCLLGEDRCYHAVVTDVLLDPAGKGERLPIDDVGRFLRLKNSIEGAVAPFGEGSSAIAGGALPNAYVSLREEVREAIGPQHQAEFDRLFPAWNEPINTSHGIHTATQHSRAKGLLGRLAGWLDGFVQEAQMAMNAQAYAEELVKQERPLGFSPPSSTE